MKKILCSYGNEKYYRSLDLLDKTSTEIGKIDHFYRYTREWLETTDFYKKNQYILDQPRGNGVWAWKPFIILETLKTLKDGDIVLYSDAGLSVIDDLTPLYEIASQNESGIILFRIPDGHLIKTWTKRDTYVLMEADEQKYYDTVMVNGALSLWKKSPETIDFLNKWQRYLRDSRIVTDSPNVCGRPDLLEFKDHRHDQSVLSIMSVQYDMEVYRDPTQFGKSELDQFSNSPYNQLFNHHRGEF